MAGVRELVEAILEYHGAGLERTLDIVRQSSGGEAAVREIARDALTGSLLLLYGLHPEDFETRVRRAVDAIPGVLLTGLTDGVVRLRATSRGNFARGGGADSLFGRSGSGGRRN